MLEYCDHSLTLRFGAYDIEMIHRLPENKKTAYREVVRRIVHQVFMDNPVFDQRAVESYLNSNLVMVVRREGEPVGFVFANILRLDCGPVLHLSGGYILADHQAHGLVQRRLVEVCLAMAAKEFGTDDFLIAVRTPSPRAIASFWDSPFFRLYPRLDQRPEESDCKMEATEFCQRVYGLDGFDPATRVISETYPLPPWEGEFPWHWDEQVNDFCRKLLSPAGKDAILFMGRTTPPLPTYGFWEEQCR